MKMQEVIVQLREKAPLAAENTSFAETLMCELVGVMEDMQNAATLTACKAIAAEAFKQCKVVQEHIVIATRAAKELQDVNAAYREKLGPRTKKSGDCPGQMVIDFGTPTEKVPDDILIGDTPFDEGNAAEGR